MPRAAIQFGSRCQPQKEKPAQKKADGFAARQDPRSRLFSCHVTTGIFPGFSTRRRQISTTLTAISQRPGRRRVPARAPHHLAGTLSRGPLARAPRGSLLCSQEASSSPATERPCKRVGAILQSCPQYFGPNSSTQKAAV